jgi:hypothetical protein
LDQYIPDQRRVQYNQSRATSNEPYYLLISGTLSQKSGSRFYQNLNDYIYTAGGDLSKNFDAFGQKQTIKGGYFFQVKDRLFDSRPFSNLTGKHEILNCAYCPKQKYLAMKTLV